MRRLLTLVLIGLFFTAIAPMAVRGERSAVETALSDDSAQADAAIAELRGAGPASLDELFFRRDDLVRQRQQSKTPAEVIDFDARIARLDHVIDRVGGQRYCSASHLYWYTDFGKAQAAARESGKPILSLRMLGNLTDDCSCANSRFFRTTLYANAAISKYLRENYVLHWKSVRPVPQVTVDFGDGRKIVRTLTGNSIHYVLDADGRSIDGLPGLYGPAAFLDWIQRSQATAKSFARLEAAAKDDFLKQYHAIRQNAVAVAWAADLRKVTPVDEPNNATRPTPVAAPSGAVQPAVPAARAAVVTETKRRAEESVLEVVAVDARPLETATDETTWEKIAALHDADARLDAASIALIRRQNPAAADAARVAISKSAVEDPVMKMVRRFQSSIALDTVRNEYQLHRKIHEWFAQGAATADVDKLNERVYAELFLTPSSDPWLGLVTPETYTAIENNGVVRAKSKQ